MPATSCWRALSPRDFGVFAVVQFALSLLAFFGDAGIAGAMVQQAQPPTERELASVFSLHRLPRRREPRASRAPRQATSPVHRRPASKARPASESLGPSRPALACLHRNPPDTLLRWDRQPVPYADGLSVLASMFAPIRPHHAGMWPCRAASARSSGRRRRRTALPRPTWLCLALANLRSQNITAQRPLAKRAVGPDCAPTLWP